MTKMTNTIERSIELKHSGAVHTFLKKNRDYLRQNPEMKTGVISAFFRSHGGKSMYNGKIELTQTDLYRLLDLAKKNVLQISDFMNLVPKTGHQTMFIMNSRVPGWASDSEILSSLTPKNKFDFKELLKRAKFENSILTDFEKDVKKVFEMNPGLKKMIEDKTTVIEVLEA